MIRGSRRRRQLARFACAAGGLMVVATSLPGCLGRSPEVQHYMLGTGTTGTPPAPVELAADSQPATLGVLVGPVRLPAYLQRPQLARLEGRGGVELDEFHRWLGGFEENFLRSLSLGLARRLDSVKVVAHPSNAPFPVDRRVRLHVDDMIRTPADELRVRVRWAVLNEGRGGTTPSPAPELHLFEESFALSGGDAAALVEAHDRAVALLVERIALALSR